MSDLAPLLPFAAAVLATVLLLAGIATWRLATRRPAEPEPPAAVAPEQPAVPGLAEPANGSLATLLAGPLVAVIGAPGASVRAVVAAARGAPVNGARAGAGHPIAIPGGAVLDFGDDLLAAPDWRERWSAAIGRMAVRRGWEGTVDALVLGVPVAVLTELWQESPAAVEGLGARFAALIEDVQRLGGLRCPVYLLLTDADTLPGFTMLAHAARSERSAETPLGWSAPYGPNAAFEPRWAEEAAETLALTLEDVALDGLSGAADFADKPGAMMALPAAVRSFGPPLRALLAATMRPSDNGEPAMFRGLFLTGAAGGPHGGEPAAFAAELFARKIFPEAGLAAPARALATRGARVARRLRIGTAATAALATLGLLALVALEEEQASVVELLALVDRYVAEDRALADRGLEPSMVALREATDQLFDAMAALEFNRVETPLAPTSYFSGLDQRLRQAIAVGFDRVALRSIGTGLTNRIIEAGAQAAQADGPTPDGFVTLADTLAEIDDDVRRFDALPHSTRPADLAQLSEAALGISPAAGFGENYELYISALGLTRQRSFDGQGAWAALETTLGHDLFEALGTAYRRDPLFEAIEAISRHAELLLAHSRSDATEVGPGLQAVMTAITVAEQLLADPAQNWLGPQRAEVDRRLEAAATRISELSFAPGALRLELAAGLHRVREAAQNELKRSRGFGGRTVIAAADTALPGLDPLFPRLRLAIDGLLDDPRYASLAQLPPTSATGSTARRFAWTNDRLNEALATVEWLQEIAAVSAPALPYDLKEIVMNAARARAENRVIQLLDAARLPLIDPGGLDDLARAEAQAFATAAPLLAELRDQAALLQLNQAAARLAATADMQARRVLAEADQQLTAARLYSPAMQGFELWDGQPGGAAGVFGLTSDASLAGLVREWRLFSQNVAQGRAGPALRYLGGSGAGAPLALAGSTAFWRDTLTVLTNYDQSAPRNDLADLERFILLDLNEMDRDSCGQRLAAIRPGPSFFGFRLEDLRAAAQRRCSALRARDTQASWAKIATAFDAGLAGRFPFVGAGESEPMAQLDRLTESADPETVRRFFARFGSELQRLGDPEAAADAVDIDAFDFAAAIGSAGAFLGVTTDGSGGRVPAFAVAVDFRTNTGHERGGDQIIEWTLRVGDTMLSSFEPQRHLVWRQGDPVALSLRWARNAPQAPAAPRRPDATLEGRTLRLVYDGPWALLALIAANAAPFPDIVLVAEPEPNLLRITSPLVQNPEAAQGDLPRLEEALVYLRLDVRALDATGSMPVGPSLAMPIFPARVPGG